MLAATLFFVSACAPAARVPAGTIEIAIVPATSSAPAFVTVTGLSSDEASELQTLISGPDDTRILTVTVRGADIPVVGRTVLNGTTLEFHPSFSFDPGRPYLVRLDSSRWRQPRSPSVAEAVVSLPAPAQAPRVAVTAVHPVENRWPENTLRFYVQFSGPMSTASGAGKVHLVGDDGEDVPNALLPLNVDLWNEDRTRYTVLFDPARVKRGILMNREMGRALIAGRRYAIVVDADWPDASGRPLASVYRHEFTAGPPLEHALEMKAWRLAEPKAGTQDTLTVTFPFALDSALLRRAIGVRSGHKTLAGKIEVPPSATAWRFTPELPWSAGRHDLVASAVLEDPAGNRINRAFEVDGGNAPVAPDSEIFSLPFDVR